MGESDGEGGHDSKDNVEISFCGAETKKGNPGRNNSISRAHCSLTRREKTEIAIIIIAVIIIIFFVAAVASYFGVPL